MKNVYEQLAKLTPEQRALFEQRLAEQGLQTPEGKILPQDRGEEISLSFAQQRLWFVQQFDVENIAYNVGAAIRFAGQLDVDRLTFALNQIVERHETLRTRFVKSPNGSPRQEIDSHQPFQLPLVNLSESEPTRCEIKSRFEALANQPFDLTQPPLRFELLRVSAAEHVLILSTHHIVCDRWSVMVFMKELAEFYRQTHVTADQEDTKRSSRRVLPIQYADWASWQRQRLEGDKLEEQLSYWRAQLRPEPAELRLPFDSISQTVTHAGKHCPLELNPELTAQIKKLANEHQASLFTILLAAFKVLLQRYSGVADIVVGSEVANRDRPETAGLIGLLVNTLVLRTDLSGDPTFVEVLDRVRETVLGGLNHQELPFEKLVEELNPQRNIDQLTPLFQVKFDLQQVPVSRTALDGLTIERIPIEESKVKYALRFNLQDNGDTISGQIEYSTDLFALETVGRMGEHFDNLLRGIISNPQATLSQLPLMSDRERRSVVAAGEGQATPVVHETLHGLFERQVKQTPTAVAVIDGDRHVSYADLNDRANELRRQFKELGVGPESSVGLCMTKSVEMIAAMLGILKAGGAFVPLDPDYPPERIEFMANDARCVAICREQNRRAVPASVNESTALSPHAGPVNDTSLAYVIYTSGSTGQPKGVGIEHRNAVALLQWAGRVFTQTDLSGVLAATSICFDLSIFEIFAPLVSGGTVILADHLLALGQISTAEKVTLVNTVPSLLRQFLRNDDLPQSVRIVNLAGEALDTELVTDLQNRGIQQINNLYGPSEDTTYSTWGRLGREHFNPEQQRVHIGTPIDNTQAFVLDEHQRLQPLGVAGELFLGGSGLARGYLQRDELTRQVFIPNPVNDYPQSVYRTGDRVRLRSDGQIEFLGRLDQQFKIRGFRIEAGEIESVLREHVDVEDALVVPFDVGKGEKQLLAYLIPAKVLRDGDPTSTVINSSVLREYLANRLPLAMVPSIWHELSSIPRLPNGKVDTSLLPRPKQPTAESKYVAPSSPTEKLLAEIWQELLKQTEVGVDDNFFELGGHSLLAIEVATKIESTFACQMPLRTFFRRPNVKSLAQYIDSKQSNATSIGPPTNSMNLSFEVEEDSVSRHEPFPLTDIQQAYWLGRNGAFELGNVSTHGYREIDTHGVSLETVEAALNALIQRHDMLRAVVNADGQQRVLPNVPNYTIAITQIDQSTSDNEASRMIRERLSHQVFATDQWPLFQVEAIQLKEQRLRFFVSFDVLLGDAWSLQILGREMAMLLAGEKLEPLSLRFRDYVIAEREFAKTERYAADWDYWMNKIDDLEAAPSLPLVKSPSEIRDPQFVRRSHRINSEAWQSLTQKASESGLTPTGVILAAFSEVLATWSGEQKFTLNLTIFNRQPVHPQVGRLVGDFTSSMLLNVDHCRSVETCDDRESGPLTMATDPNSFLWRAARLQDELWEGLEHRSVAGVRVLREWARQQDRGVGALMPVVFTSTLGQTTTSLRTEAWAADVTFALSQTSQVYLDHQISEIDGELVINWDCIDELFPPGVLDSMFQKYVEFIDQLATAEEAWETRPRLSDDAIYADFNRHLTTSQASFTKRAQSPLLHTLFFDQVKLQPSRIAIVTSECELTYAELAQHVIRLSGQLTAENVQPNELVAVSMPKSWQQVVACLAIQTAGAAYVPIDSDQPTARRHQLIRDTQARILITSIDSPLDWPDDVNRIVVSAAPADMGEMRIPSPIQSETDLAYVIYTSGSTGSPKGVMIDHRGAVNTILDINQRISLQPDDRVFALSSLSFDLSVYDLFGTLAAGATIVIPDRSSSGSSIDPRYWYEMLAKHGVTIWNSVPALFELFIDEFEHASAAPSSSKCSLRTILLSGDWISISLPSRIAQWLPNAQTISLGGATEASIWSIIHPIISMQQDWNSIPYGRSMKNQEWYVLNDNLEPCPPWVTGQLYIGGRGVAKGYWNQPELTAENFLPNPFSEDGSNILYRTGDLGRMRYLNDGTSCVELLGRDDFQVKINGHRIELGEIESVLERHPFIDQVVCDATGTPSELTAFFTLKDHSAVEQDAASDPLDRFLTKTNRSETGRFATTNRSEDVIRPQQSNAIKLTSAALSSKHIRRQSHRRFLAKEIDFNDFSRILTVLCAVDIPAETMPKFRYPSAGSLYPITPYLAVKANRIAGLAGGWYRLNPREGQLEPVAANRKADSLEFYSTNRTICDEAAFTIFLVAEMSLIEPIYESRAREFSLLEAGYMGQLLMESAPDVDLGLCPINDPELDHVPEALALPDSHRCLHGLVGGAIEAAWSDRWMATQQNSTRNLDQQLHQFLSQHLPAYMVPQHFQLLDQIPLTANGKIDRLALPAVPTTVAAFIAPRNSTEATITKMWQDLLELEQVSVDANFFRLGGNSLQAIQLLGQLRRTFEIELDMSQLFGALTPTRQAELVLNLQDQAAEPIPKIRRSTTIDTLSDEDVDAELKRMLQERSKSDGN